jgi:CRP-like cAMP-binding protein
MVKKHTKIVFEKFLSRYATEEWCLLLKNYTSVHVYSKNERIFNEGDKVKGIYFINTGKVKVVSFFDAENERILRLSKAGDILGHRAMSSQHYPISAITLTESEVTFIPIEIFHKLIKANPDFAIFIIDFLTQDLKSTEERMKSMIHNDVILRIGKIICMLIDAFGYDEEIPKKLYYTLSRADMASFAGTSYESVIRNLAKLEEMKIIKLDNKSILVLKEKELRKLTSLKSRF